MYRINLRPIIHIDLDSLKSSFNKLILKRLNVNCLRFYFSYNNSDSLLNYLDIDKLLSRHLCLRLVFEYCKNSVCYYSFLKLVLKDIEHCKFAEPFFEGRLSELVSIIYNTLTGCKRRFMIDYSNDILISYVTVSKETYIFNIEFSLAVKVNDNHFYYSKNCSYRFNIVEIFHFFNNKLMLKLAHLLNINVTDFLTCLNESLKIFLLDEFLDMLADLFENTIGIRPLFKYEKKQNFVEENNYLSNNLEEIYKRLKKMND